MSCSSSCRPSRSGFWGGEGHPVSGAPPRKARPPTPEHPLWERHVRCASRLGLQPCPVWGGHAPGSGLAGSPRPARSTWVEQGQRARSGPVGWPALYCLLHTATGFMHLRTCGREHALAFQDVGVSRLHGDDKGVFADSRPGRVSLSRARWGSQHRVQTPQWPLAPAVPPGCSRPAPAGSHLGGLSWWSWLLDLGSRVSRQHSGRPSPAGQHAGSPTPG